MSKQNTKTKIIVVYSTLYTLRAALLQLTDQIPYSYTHLPNYNIISLFSAAAYPFSFKFVIAPFQQAYTFQSYGRKKTWIVSCGLIACILLFVMSFFTNEQYQIQLAILLIICQFLICSMGTQNDSMALKQINDADKIGLVQTIFSTVGQFIGSFVFIWLISLKFSAFFGLKSQIVTVQLYLIVISIIGASVLLYFHFAYTQLKLQTQKQLRQTNVCSVAYKFKVFFDIQNKYCRTVILFLIYSLGIQFFQAGLIPQAVKRGFDKQIQTTITNACLIPTLLILFLFNRYIGKPQHRYYYLFIFSFLKFVSYFIMYLIDSVSLSAMITTLLLKQIFDNLLFLAQCQIMASFPLIALSGMYMTAMYSIRNLGTNFTLYYLIIGKYGYRQSCIYGFILQLVLLISLPFLIRWIQKGEVSEVDAAVIDNQDNEMLQQQKQNEQKGQRVN